MKIKIWILLGISLLIPQMMSAAWTDSYDFSDKESKNIRSVFTEDMFEDFMERYDLDQEDAEYFFQDSDIQTIIERLKDEKNDITEKDIFKVSDLVDTMYSIKNWKQGVLSDKFGYTPGMPDLTDNDTTLEDDLDLAYGFYYQGRDSEVTPVYSKRYEYMTLNCKVYEIVYLPKQDCYTSPDMQTPEYFITKEHLERYIDSKNPWYCKSKKIKKLQTEFDNRSKLRYIAPNGKIYYTDPNAEGRYSNEMKSVNYMSSLRGLQWEISDNNPMSY